MENKDTFLFDRRKYLVLIAGLVTHALFGSVDQIADELIRRREAYGISYITVGEDAMEPFAAVVEKLNGK